MERKLWLKNTGKPSLSAIGLAFFACSLFACSASSPVSVGIIPFGSTATDESGNTLSLTSATVTQESLIITADIACSSLNILVVTPNFQTDWRQSDLSAVTGSFSFDLAKTSSANGRKLASDTKITCNGSFDFVFAHSDGFVSKLSSDQAENGSFLFSCAFAEKNIAYTYFKVGTSNIAVLA